MKFVRPIMGLPLLVLLVAFVASCSAATCRRTLQPGVPGNGTTTEA